MALNDAQVKELISNIGYQGDNVSVSCASFLCSAPSNNQMNCHLFHASGLTIADNSPESIPLQKNLVDWVSRRFTTPASVHCAVSTLFLLVTSIEKKVDRDNEVPSNNIDANPDATSSSKAYNNIIMYAIHLLNNKSINQSILERFKNRKDGLNDIQYSYIQKFYTDKGKCLDDENTFSNLIESIFQAIFRWITQATISKELEDILIKNSIPNIVSLRGRIPHLYIQHLSDIFKANAVKVAGSIWPNWERMDRRLCTRRTSTISHSSNLTEKLSPWLDAEQRKAFLIKGIRSLSLASEYMGEDDLN